MASGSAMQQDSLLVGLAGDGASVLLPLAYFAFGIKEQIKGKPMAGVLAPEGSQNAYTIPLSQPVIRNGNQ
jgi:hypothetical protein